jgi:hypothetical protein
VATCNAHRPCKLHDTEAHHTKIHIVYRNTEPIVNGRAKRAKRKKMSR